MPSSSIPISSSFNNWKNKKTHACTSTSICTYSPVTNCFKPTVAATSPYLQTLSTGVYYQANNYVEQEAKKPRKIEKKVRERERERERERKSLAESAVICDLLLLLLLLIQLLLLLLFVFSSSSASPPPPFLFLFVFPIYFSLSSYS